MTKNLTAILTSILSPSFSEDFKRSLILFLSGINLMIIQFTVMRTFPSLLFGTEIILLIVLFSYFAGYSIGYLISDIFNEKYLFGFAVITFLLHASLPFLPRIAVGYMMARKTEVIALFSSLLFISLVLTSFYSVFLPRFISESDGSHSFSKYYTLELLGAMAGLGFIFILSSAGFAFLMIFYLLVLSIILQLLFKKDRLLLATSFIILIYGLNYHRWEKKSVEYISRVIYRHSNPKYLASFNTPYQRVELIQSEDGRTCIYLDGIEHYGSKTLKDFNFMIAGLPSELYENPSVLIVGSGSFEAVDYAAVNASKITSVEIDGIVSKMGVEFFRTKQLNRPDIPWRVVNDDAKHFIKNCKEQFDVISMDVAAPTQMQVAFLFTQEFYQNAKSRLKKGGCLSVCMSGLFEREDYFSMQILKTLTSSFKDVYVISLPMQSSFVIACDDSPFSQNEIKKVLDQHFVRRAKVYDRTVALTKLDEWDVEPISLSNLNIVLQEGTGALAKLFNYDFDDETEQD